jgi:hypothetical protein
LIFTFEIWCYVMWISSSSDVCESTDKNSAKEGNHW